MNGIERIAAERQRQIEQEGWSAEHDDDHRGGEIAQAAATYALHSTGKYGFRALTWPWHWSWWKPSQDPIRDLEKAGALIAAEIDRRLRAKARADALSEMAAADAASGLLDQSK